MTIHSHLDALYGLPAHVFPGPGERTDGLPDPESVAWRITNDPYHRDESWRAAFDRFRAAVDTTRVRALIVGAWEGASDGSPSEILKELIEAHDRFPALRALFFGDLVMEESEISWIRQGDVTPLLTAYPGLEEFGVRGGSGLEFPAVSHGSLRKLVVQTGGLPAAVVRGIGGSDLPALEHLDLWLGTPEYGGDSEVTDLEPFLTGARLPRLRHLALRNSEIQDDIAVAVASAPVVARLEVLDLSMGILTDEGAVALLGGQPLTHLKKLDLHYHYMTDELVERIRQTVEAAGVEVDLHDGGAEEEEDEDDDDEDGTVWRYVAVSE
ncbi:STM4015 family protein [Streptomyces sp. NPDC050263]|uniref:STM4015 family protein n=1 Tax=Streptomyces sp. NPDC050263 TaxID=3155037 RepID=UPI00343AE166